MPQPRSRQTRYQNMARQVAAKYGIPVRLFLSLIDHESGWQPSVTSKVGAVGLTQLMPGTARTLGVDPWNPQQNLDGGARYLHTQYKKLGSWKDALRAYNVGPNGISDPNAGLEYANSVLSGRNASKFLDTKPAGGGVSGYPGIKPPMGTFSKLPGSVSMPDMVKMLFPNDKWFQQASSKLFTPGQQFATGAPGPTPGLGPRPGPGTSYPSAYKGKVYIPASAWGGTHVTDGLDWNNGRKTAVDLFPGPPGTPVGAPEAGKVVRWGSAQGGQALYFMSDSGHLYWMGHIENMLTVGVHVNRGQAIAVISSHHATPHLHIDRYYGKNPGQFY